MEAKPVKIIEYFNGEKQSIMPVFQRPYSWNKSNWQAIWEDIMAHYTDAVVANHFMGAVVSIPAKTAPVGVTKHYVIDGQQRLTTISILLCALRDCCDEKKSAQIQDYLVNRHYSGTDDYLKILPTQCDRDYYFHLVTGSRHEIGKSLVTDCHAYFKKQVASKDTSGKTIDAGKLFDIVKDTLQVVMINLGEADDPYLIFESLNFKGEPLSQADLIRNYILMLFKNAPGEQEKIYKEIWSPMEVRLSTNIEDFLWHYSIKEGRNLRKPKIYTELKSAFHARNTNSEVLNKLNDMSVDSINYAKFIHTDTESCLRVKHELILLDRLEATICYPIMLRLFKARDTKEIDECILAKALAHLNSFLIRRAVCDEKRAPLNKLFGYIATNMPSDMSAVDQWLWMELAKKTRNERWPNDAEFKEALKTKKLYNGTKACRIILEGIENKLSGKEAIDIASNKISIEHIMPQTLTDEWKQDLGEKYEEIHSSYADTIGNLTLTGINAELGNRSYAQKREKYMESSIALNRAIAENIIWGREEMLKRADQLAQHAVRIWPMRL